MTNSPRPFARAAIAFAALCAIAAAYIGGAYSFRNDLWPIKELRKFRIALFPPSGQPEFDDFGRLANFPGKREIPCPVQTEKTAVLLVIGQSNAANSGGQRYASSAGDKAVNFFRDKCFIAASPLLGTGGVGGESWTPLADKLISTGFADRVILIPAAIGSTEISRWQAGADLNKMLLSVIDEASSRYRITHILWHQGESDFAAGTSKDEYARMFLSLADSIRGKGITAPMFLSIATKCGLNPAWTPGNPVAKAQSSLPSREKRIFQGANTDVILNPADRYDDCHFSGTGQEKFASAMVEVLLERN